MKDLQQEVQFKQALKLHQVGSLTEARGLYLDLLNAYSNHPRLLNNLAMIEFQLGQFLMGLEYIEKSIDIDPTQFSAYGNRGAALFALNRFEEAFSDYNQAISLNKNYAEAYYNRAIINEKFGNLADALKDYDQAVALKPNYANAYNNRGNLLKELRRYDQAILSYAHALKSNPRHAEAYFNRGVILKELKKYPEAISDFDQAISLKSNYVDAYNNCGNALIELRKFEDALSYFQKAIQLNPDYAYAYNGQGNVLMELKRFDEALLSYEKAIALNTNSSDALNGKSNALQALNRFDDAITGYEEAIALDPASADTYANRGLALQSLEKLDEAIQSFDKAIALNPEIADPYWNKALLKILMGEYEEGWRLYEYRRHRKGQKEAYPVYEQPLWLGQVPLHNKVLYIYPEQGLGDFIQFCRYVPLVEKLGGKVILSVPAPLYSIVKAMGLNAKIVKKDEKIDAFDLHCPIMSLPLAFKTSLENVPNAVPYFYADQAKKRDWEQKCPVTSKTLQVGLVWSGSAAHKKDHDRSIPLEKLQPLFSLPIAFYSLQKEVKEQDMAGLHGLKQLHQYQDEFVDFSDTAALVDCLDLIITVDTSVAHLAGAMAKKVWILISYLPDYRWMLNRDDSPWYPTATLFRQQNVGDWDRVINEVKHALEKLLITKT
ncbi:tetratricopeptide repeat protein [Methylophilus aquaticus]|uniref:Tetratricopeptide repeat protein n=1 Tax=Methylophilus aquaticus TaxID=1971610 RepID=A0ABT9JRZ2_9PROT|nr:tetratricopeptide repeat protein [Methylophilus aquaticus]MDP8566890.1 tetratricopeptide repeat protein [Methylophilus aquaticus]